MNLGVLLSVIQDVGTDPGSASMSEWDFGHGREPTEHHEPQYPQQPPYSYPEQQDPDYPYPYYAAISPTRRAGRVPTGTQPPKTPTTRRPPTRSPTNATNSRAAPPRPAGSNLRLPSLVLRLRDTAVLTVAGPPRIPPTASIPSRPRTSRPPPAIGEPDVADRTQAWYPGRQQYSDGPAYPGPGRAGSPAAQPGAAGRAALRLRRSLANGARRAPSHGGRAPSRGREATGHGGKATRGNGTTRRPREAAG